MPGYLPTVDWQINVTPGWTINSVARPPSIQCAAQYAPLRVIYGTVRLAAQIANVIDYGGDWIVQAIWGEGEVTSVGSITFNDETPINGGSRTDYLGTSGQTVNATLVAAFAAKGITYTDALPGISYSVFAIPAGGGVGMMTIHAVVAGMALYDPRGPTTAYSDNPALILADYASSTVYGMGLAIDWASVETVADECDDLVSGAKRRRLNLALEHPQAAEAWLDTLATYAGCWAMKEGATLTLVPDRPRSTDRSFLHASGQILDISSLKLRGVANLPTAVEIRYTNTSQTPWTEASEWAYLPGVVAGTFPRRESQIALPGIQHAAQAQREAVERLNKLTLGNLSCTLKTFDEALALQPGDVVAVTHPIGLTAKAFRVQKIESDNGRHSLSLLEYDAAVYSDAVATAPTTYDSGLPNPLDVPTPAGLTITSGSTEQITLLDGTVINRIKVAWTTPTNKFVLYGGAAVIHYKKTADSDWIVRPPIATGTGPAWISSVIDGTGYDIRVRFENARGTIGAWASTSHTVGAHTGGQIGGANLVSNTDFDYKTASQPDGFSAYNNGGASEVWTNPAGVSGGSAFGLRAGSSIAGNVFGLHTSSLLVVAGTTGGVAGGWLTSTSYVVSFYAKKVSGCAAFTGACVLHWNTAPATTVDVLNPTLSSSYQRYVFRITTGGTVESNGGLYVDVNAAAGAIATNDEIAIDRLMIQRGDVATEWSPETSTTMTALTAAIAAVASDNILSAGEKPAIKLDYDTIIAEQTGIDAQATAYSITTEKTTYDTAVSDLTTYLGTLSGWNTIPGSDVTIVGTTFRTKFGDVYTARQALLNKIAQIAGTLATWSSVSGSGKPADNATVNIVTYSASAPGSPTNGDVWVDTSVTPNLTKLRVAGAWQIGANYSTNTSQLTDGANLGGTAVWSGVSSVAVATSQVVNNAITTAAFVAENGFDRYFTAGSFGSSSGTDDYASVTVTPVSGDIVLVEASFRVITNNSTNALDYVTLTPKITCSGDSSATISAVAALWRVYDGVQYETHKLTLTYTSGGAALTAKLQIYYAIAAFTNSGYAEYTIDQCVLRVFTSRK